MADNQQPATKPEVANVTVDLVAAMREMTAEVLRWLEDFSEDYFARLDRLGRSKIELNKRLTRLEDRVTPLETRPPTK